MITIAVNPETGFLESTFLTGAEAMQQRLRNRLRLHKNEWYLAAEEGIPWRSLTGRSTDTATIKRVIAQELRRDPEYKGMNSLDVILIDTPEKAEKYNKKLRTLIINFSVIGPYGTIEGTL